MKKVVLVNAVLLIFLVVVFDVFSYWLVPDRYLHPYKDYRRIPFPNELGVAGWPRNYYEPIEAKGFDIGSMRTARLWVDGTFFPIWSNSIGCFDREHATFANYVYFAGDSFTWGYARFEDKFGTLVEQESGMPIVKCGVEHTGQRHQYAKFIEIVERTKSVPKAVFVFHFENDIANDHAYPHSTVVEGWLIDSVVTNDRHELIRRSPQELLVKFTERLERDRLKLLDEQRGTGGSWGTLKASIKRYSLTANLASAALKPSQDSLAVTTGQAGERPPANFYTIPYMANGAYSYVDNAYAKENQTALLDFKSWTERNGVPLIIVLIPRIRTSFDPTWYGEMHQFLRQNQIRFLDLASAFQEKQLDPKELYWRNDPHFNRMGNKIVAKVLLDSFPEYFRPRQFKRDE